MRARVIVGIDGSEQALTAVRAAAGEAARRNMPLHIVHAFFWPMLHVDTGPVSADMPDSGLENFAADMLAEAVRAAQAVEPGVKVTKALIDGPAAPVLIEASRGAALLVLGDRGLGAISGVIIGSVAVHAAAHADCPVLVVRGDAPPVGPVVVGVDGSESSELAVGFAFDQSSRRGVPLMPVIAWNEADTAGAHQWHSASTAAEALAGEAQRTLSEQLSGWRGKYPEVEVAPAALRGHPRKVLAELSHEAQLMVVGARGLGAFKGLMLGSVSQSLLYNSASPVAVVRGESS
ncbi:universal stress protein [Actinoplanes sp. TRM 88003]|uniref:Universal stress protein n=1 Tax=Paractinoplanes aksuensis TaxID=2939490 RepID=A0ABT1DJ13_9ACTN|nr:universal stress protein [Actinoplanes aksuensis]MCO8270463.1 universal stress protein [Actinoplanes aksuensis]